MGGFSMESIAFYEVNHRSPPPDQMAGMGRASSAVVFPSPGWVVAGTRGRRAGPLSQPHGQALKP